MLRTSLDCENLDIRQRVCEYKTCLFLFGYSSSKIVHLFTLHCLLYWTSSNCVNIVISTLKFISIINLYQYFHLLLFVQELYSKEPGGGGVIMSTRNTYCFDVFSYTFVLLNRHQPYCILKRHYMTFLRANVCFEKTCFTVTVIPGVSIYVSAVMFSYLTIYF